MPVKLSLKRRNEKVESEVLTALPHDQGKTSRTHVNFHFCQKIDLRTFQSLRKNKAVARSAKAGKAEGGLKPSA